MCFLTPFAYNVIVFRCASTVTRKVCPYVIIARSFCKIKENHHQLVFSEVCFKHVQVICRRSCLKFDLPWLPYFADS